MTSRLDVMTAAEVAEALGCTLGTIEVHARSGRLPALSFGNGGWIFPTAALTARLNELAVEESAERRNRRTPPIVATVTQRSKRVPPKLPSL